MAGENRRAMSREARDAQNRAMTRLQEKLYLNKVLLGAPLSMDELLTFERRFGIALPSGYRRFLREIGSSCQYRADGARFVSSVLDWPCPERLAVPFPFENEWIWEFEDELSHNLDEIENGSFELTDIGCGQSFRLIITGKCRGEVWHFSEMGIQPCCPRRDFFSWLEKWLDSQGDADYFEEYPYE